jgi:drug/metabolite transporter (DMT)-like permease
MSENLSSLGLGMAGATSISNVIKDVSAKKVLDSHEVIASGFWIRLFAAVTFGLALGFRALNGLLPTINPSGGPLFGVEGWDASPLMTWMAYLTVEVILVACNTILMFRAIQITPISVCMPYISFTPVFLIVTDYWINDVIPAQQYWIGVALIFIGSFVMHRALFAYGWLEPIKAIYRERGCLYMLIVGFVNALTNPIDAKLVRMTDAFAQAFAFGCGMVLFFGVLALLRRAPSGKVIRSVPGWAMLAGALEAVTLIFQLASHNYLPVAITISIKRAGIILTVLLGWLVFKEKGIGDKLIASCVMLAGAIIFYAKLTMYQGFVVAIVTLVGMSVALYFTRKPKPQLETL